MGRLRRRRKTWPNHRESVEFCSSFQKNGRTCWFSKCRVFNTDISKLAALGALGRPQLRSIPSTENHTSSLASSILDRIKFPLAKTFCSSSTLIAHPFWRFPSEEWKDLVSQGSVI